MMNWMAMAGHGCTDQNVNNIRKPPESAAYHGRSLVEQIYARSTANAKKGSLFSGKYPNFTMQESKASTTTDSEEEGKKEELLNVALKRKASNGNGNGIDLSLSLSMKNNNMRQEDEGIISKRKRTHWDIKEEEEVDSNLLCLSLSSSSSAASKTESYDSIDLNVSIKNPTLASTLDLTI